MHPKPISPNANQRSVWDFPRPPIIELENRPVKIILNGVVIAETSKALKVLETSHPPVFHLPTRRHPGRRSTNGIANQFLRIQGDGKLL